MGPLRAGTRISEGLKVASEALRREGQTGGTLILLSDLEILPDEVQRLVTVFADLRRDGFEVRIVPLAPREEQRRLIELLVGDQALAPGAGERGGGRPGAGRGRLTEGLPWVFLLVGLVLVPRSRRTSACSHVSR